MSVISDSGVCGFLLLSVLIVHAAHAKNGCAMAAILICSCPCQGSPWPCPKPPIRTDCFTCTVYHIAHSTDAIRFMTADNVYYTGMRVGMSSLHLPWSRMKRHALRQQSPSPASCKRTHLLYKLIGERSVPQLDTLPPGRFWPMLSLTLQIAC